MRRDRGSVDVAGGGEALGQHAYLTHTVYEVVLQKSTPVQIRQRILQISNIKGQADVFVWKLTLGLKDTVSETRPRQRGRRQQRRGTRPARATGGAAAAAPSCSCSQDLRQSRLDNGSEGS